MVISEIPRSYFCQELVGRRVKYKFIPPFIHSFTNIGKLKKLLPRIPFWLTVSGYVCTTREADSISWVFMLAEGFFLCVHFLFVNCDASRPDIFMRVCEECGEHVTRPDTMATSQWVAGIIY